MGLLVELCCCDDYGSMMMSLMIERLKDIRFCVFGAFWRMVVGLGDIRC